MKTEYTGNDWLRHLGLPKLVQTLESQDPSSRMICANYREGSGIAFAFIWQIEDGCCYEFDADWSIGSPHQAISVSGGFWLSRGEIVFPGEVAAEDARRFALVCRRAQRLRRASQAIRT